MSSTTASMSCPSCQGLGRSHRSATLVCSQTASCPGCLPCHSCPSLVTSGSVPGNNHGPATGSRTGSPTRRPPLPPVLAIKDGIPGKTAMTSPSKTSTPEAREFTAEQSPKISSPEVARQSSSSSLINSVTALDSATASTSKLANDMPNSPPRRSGSMHIPRQARAEKVIHLSKKMGESQISGGDSGTKDSSVTSSGSMGGLRKSASAHYKSLYMLSQRAAQKRGEKTSGSLTSVSPTATTTTMSKSESQEHPFSERSRRETCDTVQSAITDSSIFSDPDAAKSSRLSLVASVATVKISKPLERYAGQKESVLRSSMTLSSSIPSVTGSLSPSSPGAPQESETEERQSPGDATSPTVKLKNWIRELEADSKRRTQHVQQLEIPETPISLSSLFGEPGSDPDILPDRLIWWAKVYEGLKGGPEWMSNLGLIVSQPQSLSPVSPGAASLNDELVSRILDIFEDGQIDDVTYAKNETTKRMEIKTGSSKALMDALIFPLDQDSYFAQEFLCAYRFFLSGQDLLDTLVGWYNVDAQDADKRDLDFLRLHRRQIQVKVMSVLLSWVRDHFQDFLANRTLHGQLMLFVKYLSQASYGDHQKITTAVREQWLNWYSYLYIPPIAQIANSLSEIRCSIMDVDSEYFAYHLTAIDHLLYRQVKQNAYLSLLVESVPKAGAGYQTGLKMILEHVSWFRSVAYYVSSIINKEESVKRRTLAIKRFLRVARHLFKLGNFFGLFAVMHGLRRPHSLVCVAAWEGLKLKYIDDFKELMQVVDPKDGYIQYWTHFKAAEAPGIPFFPLHMMELMETHQSLDTFLDDDEATDAIQEEPLVNFNKFHRLHLIISELEHFRQVGYVGEKFDTRDSQVAMYEHIRRVVTYEGDSPSVPPETWNNVAKGTVKKLSSLVKW